ncbi:2213_t:CDS:2 [Dentiscutata erythropus]|uniref:2213_t:CDS:1 n=1 Tax=Dentiscutata erythropus TaxID=1348616 RepID=A0A9N8WC88_9GLOM|nr:2213_t:CDS:2 [Dentiscutata erythropus]
MSSRWGSTPQCPRCNKAVYMAEQVIGPTGPWHRACLTCIDCKKRLDSYALAEHDGEAYCKTCHGRRFGPKGYGFASGTSFLSTDKPVSKSNGISKNDADSDKVSQSPPKSATNPSSETYGIFSTKPQSSKGPKRSWTFPVSNDICPRCTKAVYAAEAVMGAGIKYHKLCLRCETCSKLLNSTNITDRDGKLYCSSCYSREFGPKGYGYGGGAAFLTTEGTAR